MSNEIKQELQKIEIPKELHERTKLGVKSAKAEKQKRKTVQLNYKRWISVASVFGILLAIMIGTSFFNNDEKLQGINFAITAYASSDDESRLITSEKATIELATEDRIGLTSIGGSGPNLIFTDVRLNITGEQIDSITYTLSEGKFIEDVTFTSEEYMDSKWLSSENINYITSEPGSDVYQGIKEIGNTYTVNYNEQDKHIYTLAIPHDGNEVIGDDITIKVKVKYTDGNSEKQDIVVTQELDSISLKLK